MRLDIKGAGQEVGRSAFVLKTKKSKVLLDYGMKIEPYGLEYPEKINERLDAVILSHAHMDHSGMIPSLYGKYNPPLYMTKPTLDICDILWKDAMKIARLEQKEGEFNREQVRIAKANARLLDYREKRQITEDMELRFYDAGHILGSALCVIESKEKNVIYSGDFKVDKTRLHAGMDFDIEENIDVAIIESTYGNRDHPDRKEVEKMFLEHINDTLDKGGSILIPAFALGRGQEILEILDRAKIDVPIYYDGMGQRISKVYLRYPHYFKGAYNLRKALSKTHKVKDHKKRQKVLEEQAIIVTTAGMLEGGPALYYIKELYKKEENAIYLTGFQCPDTKGANLLRDRSIEIDGKNYPWKGSLKKFDFSAHPGQKNMLRALNAWSPEKVICIHGDKAVVKKFTEVIKEELGIEAVGPAIGDSVKL